MEFIVAVGILGILTAIIFRTFAYTVERSDAARCASNLRSIHTSLSAYLQDKGHWPQEPAWVWGGDNAKYEDWWMKELEPYGTTDRVWQCNTIMRKVVSKTKDKRPRMHYVPTMFDEKPMTPYRWSTQPWLVEIGNMHGVGALICFPDGTVRPMDEVMRGR